MEAVEEEVLLLWEEVVVGFQVARAGHSGEEEGHLTFLVVSQAVADQADQ